MLALYILAGVAAIALLNWLWFRTPDPVVPLVPRTGLTVDGKGGISRGAKTSTTPELRHVIVNLRWRINQ